MREWATQRAIPHRYVGICSDTRAGRNDEDASLEELEIPVTTDPAAISQALRSVPPDSMTVVFCTYQSLDLVRQAQDDGAPPFDLILCDEAHRTTGIERPGDKTSPFVLVHDAERIRAARRLYMTATPRLYTDSAKARAALHSVDVFSMDDERPTGRSSIACRSRAQWSKTCCRITRSWCSPCRSSTWTPPCRPTWRQATARST